MGISSCGTMHEPDVWMCTIIDGEEAACVNSIDESKTMRMSVHDMIGFISVSPEGYADIKTHHEILHRELKDCKR